MAFFKGKRSHKRRHDRHDRHQHHQQNVDRSDRHQHFENREHQQQAEHHEMVEHSTPDSTGREAEALKSLVDSKSIVTVLLSSGEKMRGQIRYYDRDCFSIGLTSGGPKIFLRKDSVMSITEE